MYLIVTDFVGEFGIRYFIQNILILLLLGLLYSKRDESIIKPRGIKDNVDVVIMSSLYRTTVNTKKNICFNLLWKTHNKRQQAI